MSSPELLSLSTDALTERLGGPGRASAVYRQLRAGRDPFTDPQIPSGARERLSLACRSTVAEVRQRVGSADGTQRLVLSLHDQRAVETVLIPSRGRTTVCVSSQVGCARACSFCATGQMGLLRNLSCAEIVAQVVTAIQLAPKHDLPPVRNVVFMGMGEPLDNLLEVEHALPLIETLGIGRRHTTVSTVGTSPGAVLRAAALPANLAWSLHTADDELRRRLIPTARTSVGDLRDAFARALNCSGDPLFVEIVLIEGINDFVDGASKVAALLDGLEGEVRINLLPMNTIGGDQKASPRQRVDAYRACLIEAGYFCMVRRPRGSDERSACGQLINDSPGIVRPTSPRGS